MRFYTLKIAMFVGVIFALLVGMSEAGKPAYTNILLTKDSTHRTAQNTFDCKSRIHVVLEGVRTKGSHVLEAYWVSPDGTREQFSRQEFRVNSVPVDAWVWLKLQPGFGGKMLASIDSGAGMDGYIGSWTVKVYLDEHLIDEQGFFVVC